MPIHYNPNLRPNDSLTPEQIRAKTDERNAQTREMVSKAYQSGGVPVSSAERAAEHSSVSRQTAEAQKSYRDARTWWNAKNGEGSCNDD